MQQVQIGMLLSVPIVTRVSVVVSARNFRSVFTRTYFLVCVVHCNRSCWLQMNAGAAYWSNRSNHTAAMIHSKLWDDNDQFYYYRTDTALDTTQSLAGATTTSGASSDADGFVRIKIASGFAPLLLPGVNLTAI